MTNSISEILGSDAIFVTGTNTTENHPVIGARIKRAVKNGTKLIVAEPRRIELADYADVFLQIKPGTNIALLNGMMHVIIKEDLHDKKYIENRMENFEELKELVKEYTPEKVAEICDIDKEDLIKAARIYGKAQSASIFYAMGITQHATGTYGVMSVANLSNLCGNVGIESGGVNPLRGQNNVQGACDMGALPNVFPGYQKVTDEKAINKFSKAWNVELSNKVGLTIPEILEGAHKGDIKFLYVMGENPMVSDPDINHVRKALMELDFLVVQDIFLTETAELADVVLPAASFAEKEGTFTNTERRIQRVRKAVNPPGEAKADWEIIMTIMNLIGYKNEYSSASEIMDEISKVTPQYGGINYDRDELKADGKGLQWPCIDKDHPGTKYLHKGNHARGKGIFLPHDHVGSVEQPDEEYPLVLTTGRVLYHYHTRSMTGRVEGLNQKSGYSYIEINSDTANKLQVSDGEKVKVVSRRGEINTTVKVTDIVPESVVFMPFHFAEGAANVLTNPARDKIANIPEYKSCAVRIEKTIKAYIAS